MSPAPSVLLIGLPWDHLELAKQVPDPTVTRGGLEAVAAFICGTGYTFDYFRIGPDNAPANDELVA